jgi:hypothetical protein
VSPLPHTPNLKLVALKYIRRHLRLFAYLRWHLYHSYLGLPDVVENGEVVGGGGGLGGRHVGGGGQDQPVTHESLALVMATGAQRLIGGKLCKTVGVKERSKKVLNRE